MCAVMALALGLALGKWLTDQRWRGNAGEDTDKPPMPMLETWRNDQLTAWQQAIAVERLRREQARVQSPQCEAAS
jgi:hypothetical protein